MHERIRQRRKELGLSQAELAKKAGITQTGISAIEKNKNDTTCSVIAKIATALDVSTDYLINGTTNKPPEGHFSKQQQELLEITDKMTDQQQTELLGAVKMFLIKNPQ